MKKIALTLAATLAFAGAAFAEPVKIGVAAEPVGGALPLAIAKVPELDELFVEPLGRQQSVVVADGEVDVAGDGRAAGGFPYPDKLVACGQGRNGRMVGRQKADAQ